MATIVIRQAVSWANSAPTGTQQVVTVPTPESFQASASYRIILHHPGAVALAMSVQVREDFSDLLSGGVAGAVIWANVDTSTIPAGSSVSRVFDGALLADRQCRFVFSNNAAVAATGGFTSRMLIEQVT